MLRKYDLNLGKALKAQQDSPLGNRKEFNPPSVLQQVFGCHPLWNWMEAFLLEGSKWLLVEISKNDQQQDLIDALTFGNHKGASQKPVLLKKLIKKDVKYGYSLPVQHSSVQLIPGLAMTPMNILAQNTIDKFGWIISKDRLTHDQSWKWSSGTYLNSRIQKELLQAYRCCFCIRRLINWAIAARRKYSGQQILPPKIDYKSAYCQGILHFATALKAATQFLEDNLVIITLQLTFGSAPCLFKWGVMLESICDLANKLLKCKEWDPIILHTLVQANIPTWEHLDDNVPFVMGREYYWRPSQPLWLCERLHWQHDPTYHGSPQDMQHQQTWSGNTPCNQRSSLAKWRQRTYPLGANGGARQVKSRRGISRDGSFSWMAFQLLHTHRDPPWA